ncbi:hypothetical protein WJT74_10345 [Sphingomicrobium sp. XHP0239]|uniref:hypothetical protein n=1 Tax=Sphingomicrobium maritimum TaxID=3133972 RepID=UPI0031CCAE4D
MSPAVRFLSLVVVGWAGVRLLAAEFLETGALFEDAGSEQVAAASAPAPASADHARVSRPADSQPPVSEYREAQAAPDGWPPGAIMTPYGMLIPYGAAMPAPGGPGTMSAASMMAPPPRYRERIVDVPRYRYRTIDVPVPHYLQASGRPPEQLIGYRLADGSPVFAAAPTGRDAPVPEAASTVSISAAQVLPPPVAAPRPEGALPDRWQLSAWSFLRDALGGRGGTAGLAPASTLGGDQSGVRLLYNHDQNWGLAARYSSATGSVAGDEVALGLRYRPVPRWPLAFTLERREALSSGPAARSAFAAFLETGISGEPMPARFRLDAYAQAGAVGIEDPDWFIDGAATATRRLYGPLRGGVGLWGAAQRGATRLDVGPRVSLPLHKRIRLHADYRARVAGDAAPGSGPTLTIAADL